MLGFPFIYMALAQLQDSQK